MMEQKHTYFIELKIRRIIGNKFEVLDGNRMINYGIFIFDKEMIKEYEVGLPVDLSNARYLCDRLTLLKLLN